MICERKIMRKMLAATRSDDGYWRIETNHEISDILRGQIIIWFIKNQRLNWLDHFEHMTEDNNVKKIKHQPLVYRHLNACSPLPARIFLAFKS
jgi:hypothetical protein